jgi:hypothetical protein
MTAYPITPKMNKASFNEPEAIAPLEPASSKRQTRKRYPLRIAEHLPTLCRAPEFIAR